MTVIELIRLLTGHSQSHAKPVHIIFGKTDIGELSEYWTEDEKAVYLEVNQNESA